MWSKSSAASGISREESVDLEDNADITVYKQSPGLGLKRPLHDREGGTPSKRSRFKLANVIDEEMAEGWVKSLQHLIKGKISFDKEV